ncbi:MAG: phosphotransferase, partial [Rhodothermaceae bacterium]|nr:phosphotransferase [Rhodothermaceae bacterium]
MLAAPDQLLVRNDPALPGLPLLLDAEAFAEVLRPHVGALDAAEAVYVRYKPGENALVAYRLYMGGAAHWAYAKSHRHGATTKLTKATTRTTAATPLGPGHLVLPAWATVVSFFPNDAKLKALRRLGNPAARRGLIEKLLPERPDLLDLEPVLLRYKPERRYVARLGDVALKLHSPSGFAGAIQGRAGARSREAFQTPRVVGRSKRHRALAYAWIDGAVLADAIRAEGFDPRAVVPVGAALATLHAQPLDATWAPSDPSESLRAAAEAVGATTPTLAIRAEALAARLSTRLASPEPIALVHGDFYAKQVLLSPTTPTVLDLDRLMLGDPAADLGMFLAHLERDRLRFGLAPSRIDAVRADLLAGYAAVAEPLPDASVALHTAAAILQLAPHPFRFREPDWPARTAALLDTAEAYLDEGLRLYQPRASVSAQRPATVFDPEDAASDPKLPTLGHALDPVQATSALRALIHPSEGKRESLKLMSVRVVRHRPGRRALLEYRFEGPEEPVTLLGKVRAKGLDRSTFALMTSLWQSGFGSSATDRVSVPEPVGVWPEARMWLQRRVPGISAATALA